MQRHELPPGDVVTCLRPATTSRKTLWQWLRGKTWFWIIVLVGALYGANWVLDQWLAALHTEKEPPHGIYYYHCIHCERSVSVEGERDIYCLDCASRMTEGRAE